MTIVQQIDGIGFNEMNRDVENGDDLEVRCRRAIEKADDNPTKKNKQLAQEITKKFNDYIEWFEKKYGIEPNE